MSRCPDAGPLGAPPIHPPAPSSPLLLPPQENLRVDLTKSVQAWGNGQTNYGWFFEPTSHDGWDFRTAEGKQPPALEAEVADPLWCSRHGNRTGGPQWSARRIYPPTQST